MIAIEETTAVQAGGTLVLRHPKLRTGDLVRVIVLLENPPLPGLPGRKLLQDWAGGLADLAEEFTSVQLQHKASLGSDESRIAELPRS